MHPADLLSMPPYTFADYESAWLRLRAYTKERWGAAAVAARHQVLGRYRRFMPLLPAELVERVANAADLRMCFDHRYESGKRAVDHFVEEEPLTPGERACMTMRQASSVHIYEVTRVRPKKPAIHLRDLIEHTRVEITQHYDEADLTGSCIVGRIWANPDRQLVIDIDTLYLYPENRNRVLTAFEDLRARFRDAYPDRPLEDSYEFLGAIAWETFLGSVVEESFPLN